MLYTQVSLSPEHTAENGKVFGDTTPTSHFAMALKRARLDKRWKQEELANKLHVTLRAVVSWETGARIPSSGMVFLLCILLSDDADHEVKTTDLLRHDLLISYLTDDLQRQTQIHLNEAFRHLADQGIEQLSHLSEEKYPSEQEHEQLPLSFEQVVPQDPSIVEKSQRDKTSIATLQQFFTLFEQLRQHPELIAVAHDFVREMAHV